MFGFFNKKKEETKPPIPRRDDDLAKTADFVQATGDCAKAEGDGMILMFRSGILQPHEFFPGFLKTDVFMLLKSLDNMNEPLFLGHPDGAPRLAIFYVTGTSKAYTGKASRVSLCCESSLSANPVGITHRNRDGYESGKRSRDVPDGTRTIREVQGRLLPAS